MMKTIFVVSALSLLFLILLSLWGFYWALFPLRIVSSLTPSQFNLPYEPISFSTQDHVTIKGWFIPSAKKTSKTVILLHGYPADKGNILPSRAFLHSYFNLVFIDFRYLGESGGKYSTAGKNEVLDLLAAINYLKTRGIHEVGVWGFSLGGSVALMAAEQSPTIKAVVAEAPYASLNKMAADYFTIPLLKYPLGLLLRLWGWLFLGYDINTVSPLAAAETLSIPVLIMYLNQDNVIPFSHAELMQEKLKNKPNIQFIYYDRLSHGQAPDEFAKVVEDFFKKNL